MLHHAHARRAPRSHKEAEGKHLRMIMLGTKDVTQNKTEHPRKVKP